MQQINLVYGCITITIRFKVCEGDRVHMEVVEMPMAMKKKKITVSSKKVHNKKVKK